MIYVSDRSADSICDTALLFLVMKSEYMPSHRGGIESTSPVFCVACLYIVVGPRSQGLSRGRSGGVASQEVGAMMTGAMSCRVALPRPNDPCPLFPQLVRTSTSQMLELSSVIFSRTSLEPHRNSVIPIVSMNPSKRTHYRI